MLLIEAPIKILIFPKWCLKGAVLIALLYYPFLTMFEISVNAPFFHEIFEKCSKIGVYPCSSIGNRRILGTEVKHFAYQYEDEDGGNYDLDDFGDYTLVICVFIVIFTTF